MSSVKDKEALKDAFLLVHDFLSAQACTATVKALVKEAPKEYGLKTRTPAAEGSVKLLQLLHQPQPNGKPIDHDESSSDSDSSSEDGSSSDSDDSDSESERDAVAKPADKKYAAVPPPPAAAATKKVDSSSSSSGDSSSESESDSDESVASKVVAEAKPVAKSAINTIKATASTSTPKKAAKEAVQKTAPAADSSSSEEDSSSDESSSDDEEAKKPEAAVSNIVKPATKAVQFAAKKAASSSSAESSSESSSGSESESSESSDESSSEEDEKAKPQPVKTPAKGNKSSSSESSSSEDDSSDSSSDSESESASESESDSDEEDTQKKAPSSNILPAALTKAANTASSGPFTGFTKKTDESNPTVTGQKRKASASSSSDSSSDTIDSSDSDSSDSEDEAPPAKKKAITQTHTTVQIPVSAAGTIQVTQDSGPATLIVDTPTPADSRSGTSTPNPANDLINKDRLKKLKTNAPFRRVRVEDHVVDERLKDNSFDAKLGAARTDYGFRAAQDLIVTRGDSFRKAKDKKKKGSYRGGEITMQSHSIKF